MSKKLLVFIIVLIILLGLFFAYNYFTDLKVKAPTIENTPMIKNSGFIGPSGPPSIKGPSGPPPMRE